MYNSIVNGAGLYLNVSQEDYTYLVRNSDDYWLEIDVDDELIEFNEDKSKMVNKSFFSRHNLIYRFASKLNLNEAVEIKTGKYKFNSLNNLQISESQLEKHEILDYKLSNPYFSYNINTDLKRLAYTPINNLLKEFIIKFLELNHYRNGLSFIQPLIDATLEHIDQELIPVKPDFNELQKIKERSIEVYLDSIKNTEFTDLHSLLLGLNRLKPSNYFSFYTPYVGRDYGNKDRGKTTKEFNDELVRSCIDRMIDEKEFVWQTTIKKRMPGMGRDPITRVRKERESEIKKANKQNYGVTSLAQYKKKYKSEP